MMQNKNARCNETDLAELLFEPEMASEPVSNHVAECIPCQQKLVELQATMNLLDEWKCPEVSPYFMTRLGAQLNEAREAQPTSWWERLRFGLSDRFDSALRTTSHPIAAMALTVTLLLGGGAYVGLFGLWQQTTPQPEQAAVVHDLQTLDKNAQLLDQLEAMSNAPDRGN